MNLKRSVICMLAVGTLTFGLVSGAMAEDNHSAPVQGTFDQATCGIVVDVPAGGATHFDIGSWTWNGTTYVPDAGAGSVDIGYVAVESRDPNTACSYTVQLSGPLTGIDTTNTIAATAFTWDGQALGGSGGVSVSNTATSGTFALSTSADLSGAQPDTYSGTLNFTIPDGQ